MKKYKNVADFFNTRGPEDIERFVDKNLDISEQVYALIQEKGWSQKQFAETLGKSDAEVSKWLSGTHNLTLRSIAKMEAALEANIIMTPLKAKEQFGSSNIVKMKFSANKNNILPDNSNYKETRQDTQVNDDAANPVAA